MGLEQHIAVDELLIGLAARKAFPLQDATVIGRLLCPLFAKSPLQQEVFTACYKNWLERVSVVESDAGPTFRLWHPEVTKVSAPVIKPEKKSVFLLRFAETLGWLIPLLLTIVILVFGVWSFIQVSHFGNQHSAEPVNSAVTRPKPKIVAPQVVNRSDLSRWIWIFATGISLILFVSIYLRRRLDIFLQRKFEERMPEISNIPVCRPYRPLFRSNLVAKTSYDLRRSRLIKQDRLDPEMTVAASIRSGGFFVPVTLQRRVVPEYIVLIDRRTFADHATALTASLLDRLSEDGLVLSTYYFDRSARFCIPSAVRPEGYGKSIPIEELAERHVGARLLVFADPVNILQPGSNVPRDWLQKLAAISWSSGPSIPLPARTPGAALPLQDGSRVLKECLLPRAGVA